MKSARAYYVGGFGVGCGVPRVKILEKIAENKYRVQVTSQKCYAYTFREIFIAWDHDLYDRRWYIPSPKCITAGKRWREFFTNKEA